MSALSGIAERGYESADVPEDWSDADLPSKDFPVEKFLEQLEQRMLRCENRFLLRSWAKAEWGVEKPLLEKFKQLIQASWHYERMPTTEMFARRQNVRNKLEAIYEAVMKKELYSTALDVVKTIADLDGLKTPDVNLTQINVSGADKITNHARERVAELMEIMRARADKRRELREEREHDRILAAKSANGNGHEGSNGSSEGSKP